MRAAFRAELDKLLGDLAGMGRLAGQIMINASAALLQADLALTELAIARGDELDVQHHDMQQRCTTLLAPHGAVGTDLQTVVEVIHAARHLKRMGELAQDTAKIARLAHPTLTIPDHLRTVIAQMGLFAGGLAHQAATAIEKPDPLAGDRLAQAHDEVDVLRRQLFSIVFAKNWSHGVEPAVTAALVGRCYERFSHHAVAITQQVCYAVTAERTPKPPGSFARRGVAPVEEREKEGE